MSGTDYSTRFRFCNCQSYFFLTNSLTVKVDCLGVLELNPPQGKSCKFSRDLFNTINRFPLISEQYNTLSALPHTYSLRPFSLNHVCNFADVFTRSSSLNVQTLKLCTLSVLALWNIKYGRSIVRQQQTVNSYVMKKIVLNSLSLTSSYY